MCCWRLLLAQRALRADKSDFENSPLVGACVVGGRCGPRGRQRPETRDSHTHTKNTQKVIMSQKRVTKPLREGPSLFFVGRLHPHPYFLGVPIFRWWIWLLLFLWGALLIFVGSFRGPGTNPSFLGGWRSLFCLVTFSRELHPGKG